MGDWDVDALWAKSLREPPGRGELVAWLPLTQHMADSGAVSESLWDEWLPHQVKDRIAREIGDDGASRALLACLASLHDIGKATPAFQSKDPTLADRVRRAGFPLPRERTSITDVRLLPHGLAGQVIVTERLVARGLRAPDAECLAVVVGGHHGAPPERSVLNAAQHLSAARGTEIWLDAQIHIANPHVDEIMALVEAGHQVQLTPAAQVLLSAAVIVSDWLASSAELFPLQDIRARPGAPVSKAPGSRARDAWRRLQLPGPMAFRGLEGGLELAFSTHLGLPAGSRPRDVQRAAVAAAEQAAGPALVIVEAETGSGKTEAALLAAEVLAGHTGAGGVFVGLPTRATSDAILPRVQRWVEAGVGDGGSAALNLVHGKAALNADFMALPVVRLAPIGQDERDADGDNAIYSRQRGGGDPQVAAHEWLRGRKRRMLATVVVGTIDQILFMALKSKHLALRHLALAGKVVIIDEVHAYDAYMGTYLHRALRWLGEYGVPVILLSATLTPSARASLIDAYAPAQVAPGPAWSRKPAQKVAPDLAYPAVRLAAGDRRLTLPFSAASSRQVRLERLSPDDDGLIGILRDRLSDGGCALVVRNTVREVQQTGRVLTRAFPTFEVTVSHSRFIATDRARRDRELVERFGPRGQRPTRAIVVASQVVEQSLDVDFDLLVTDIAPIDLLIQRIGRLHRHAGTHRPPKLSDPVVILRGVEDWRETEPRPLAGSLRVYSPWVLSRTLNVLRDADFLALPDQVPDLVYKVYDHPGVLAAEAEQEERLKERHEAEMERKRIRAETFRLSVPQREGSIVNWLGADVGNADDTPQGRAQVRDSADSLEVIALRRTNSGEVGTMPWEDRPPSGNLDGPTPIGPADARRVALSTLALPAQLSGEEVITDLESRYFLSALQSSPWTKGELVLVFDKEGFVTVGGRELQYTQEYGLEELAK